MNFIKLESAQKLVDAGAVQAVEIIGVPGGWEITLQTATSEQRLATRTLEPRHFLKVETAIALIQEKLGMVGKLVIDPTEWTAVGPKTRIRPDRTQSLKAKEEDSRYMDYVRAGLNAARDDRRPSLSAEDAEQLMTKRRAENRAKHGHS